MSATDDRLYNLLPAIYRLRDAQQGYPLRALLQVIAEQVDVVETDIAQLYDNWFIETCQEWVIPYIGALIGYESTPLASVPADQISGKLEAVLAPRREVANTIRNRRRKGTLAVLEALANETAGWPARAVERFRELGWTQRMNYLHPKRGRLVDLRNAHALDLATTPFDALAHAAHVATRNINSVSVFVWRLKSYPVTWTQACCIDNQPNCYTFSILGNNAPLFTRPQREADPNEILSELDVPTPIRRRIFEHRDSAGRVSANPDYYGPGKSIEIRTDRDGKCKTYTAQEILPADLSRWYYRPPHGKVAVDPHLGRLAFDSEQPGDVWVRYQYGFSADIGGGEYDRAVTQPDGAQFFYVGIADKDSCVRANPGKPDKDSLPEKLYASIGEALHAAQGLANVVIEIVDSRLYEEQVRIVVPDDAKFQLRAAPGKRPVIQIVDKKKSRDALRVEIGKHSRVVLDGLMVAGRAVNVRGKGDESECVPSITIRHCTLVPGWNIDEHCCATDGEEASLELVDTCATVCIEHSILGSIEVSQNQALTDPVRIHISDSIVDATSPDLDAVSGAARCGIAYANLCIARSTVIGHTHVHVLQLAEDSIFFGVVQVARRQIGCVRFCYVPRNSRTPRRYECQPDLALAKVEAADQDSEALRVEPQFNSTSYGSPVYCQLATGGPPEIAAGASDDSEMGVFHDLYQPQRTGNLTQRLSEYVPASTDVEIVYAS